MRYIKRRKTRKEKKAAARQSETAGLSAQLANDYNGLIQEARLPRLVQHGSLDCKTYSIMVDTSLPPLQLELVLRHELAHADLSQMHFGEAIRRLESLAAVMITPLNKLREKIIRNTYTASFGSPEDDGWMFYGRVSKDPDFRSIIRDRLRSDPVFMGCLAFLEDLEHRKVTLERYWKTVQEGGANWLGLTAFAIRHNRDNPEIKRMYLECCERLISGKGAAALGFANILDLYAKVGAEWVYPLLIVCVHPDITRLSLLTAPISAVEAELQTTRLSPDCRFFEVCRLVLSGEFVPSEESLPSLYTILDPGNPTALLTLKQFDEYWHRVDADERYVSLMNRLLQRIGVERDFEPIHSSPQHTSLDDGEPYHIDYLPRFAKQELVIGRVFRRIGLKPEFPLREEEPDPGQPVSGGPLVVIGDKSGKLLYDGFPKNGGWRWEVVEQKLIFLKTMRAEGLMHVSTN